MTAIVGKGGASAIAARAMGLEWRAAGALGALVNTRGLIELVILNIGLEAGILSPVAFSIMVVMALVTTFMTSPLLKLLLPENGARHL
jgi:Kef-type K+ transport system membrane component KefB